MKTKTKVIWTLVICLTSVCCYLGAYYQKALQEKVTITGMQIAKRTCSHAYSPYKSTKVYHEDKFYVLLDSQYGVMEIPVTYYSYLYSSNEQVHSYKLSASNCLEYLDNTQDFCKAYPALRYANNWGTPPLVLGIFSLIIGLATAIAFSTTDTSKENRIMAWAWFSFNVLAVIIALIF